MRSRVRPSPAAAPSRRQPIGHQYLDDPVAREEGGTPAIVESIRARLVVALRQAVGTEVIQASEERPWKRPCAAGQQTRASRCPATPRPAGCRSSRCLASATGPRCLIRVLLWGLPAGDGRRNADVPSSSEPYSTAHRQMKASSLARHHWHGDWNYTLRPEAYDQISSAPDPFDRPSADLAWLAHPVLTGLPAPDWDALVTVLLTLHDQRREASLDKRRGHRPRAGEVVRSGLDDVSGLAQELADMADALVDRFGPDAEQGGDGDRGRCRPWWRLVARSLSARVRTGRRT